MRGLITNIQRFSIHDGPGIRSTVFLKGCPLRCFWCHNPEAQVLGPEIQSFPEPCIGCGRRAERCPEGAHAVEDGQRVFRRDLCQACGLCVETCYAEALVMAGRYWTEEEVLAELVRDREFYLRSGGGITLSGGEPTQQYKFCLSLLQRCRETAFHTAMDTAACCPWDTLAELLPWLDLVIVDLKLLDDDAHRVATGASNRLILDNVQRLGTTGVPLVVRTPVASGVNDTAEAIGAVAGFIKRLPNLLHYELMPFHRLAGGKYRSLGRPDQAGALLPPERETILALSTLASDLGVGMVKVG